MQCLGKKGKRNRIIYRVQMLMIFAVFGCISLQLVSCQKQANTVSRDGNVFHIADEDDKAAEAAETVDVVRGQMTDLEAALNRLIESNVGTWCIYVKDLSDGESFSINNQSMYAASLIKLFVMEETYANFDAVVGNIESDSALSTEGSDALSKLMELMIEQSDNESYNEIVRLHSASHSFTEGCLIIEDYLKSSNYSETGIYHTLSPSSSESESTSLTKKNHTSVEDCGRLLEAIYSGMCVSRVASDAMLKLLLNQERTDKIPMGVPDDILVANKTGETDEYQHDAAIVYGEETDYILCVMARCSDTSAATTMRKISKIVYAYLNGVEDWETAGEESEEKVEKSDDGGWKWNPLLEEPDGSISYGVEEAAGESDAWREYMSNEETELGGSCTKTGELGEETAKKPFEGLIQ